MLAQLAQDRRVVPLAYHVDYFDEPWKDPFSHRLFSGRQWQYSLLYKKDQKIEEENKLFFTPMLMVDGRTPMNGSDRDRAQAAIRRALAERQGIVITPTLKKGDHARAKTLTIGLSSPAPALTGKDVLVSVAIYETPLTTKVLKGENARKTLVEHFVVRHLDVQSFKPERSKPTTLTYDAKLEDSWEPSKCGLVIFAQDEKTGKIHQAESVPWTASTATEKAEPAAP